MAEILIGTSGYSYNVWVGCVYPDGTKPKDFLKCYSKLFPTVELNFSYYQMPKAENLSKMLADSGDNLTFSIKAHKTLTHEIVPGQWENEAKTFRTAIEPLIEAKRLEAVLFQFPFSFKYEDGNRRYLDRLLKYFDGIPLAVEFRKVDWFNNKVIDGMKSRNISFVSLDMPDLPKLPPVLDVITAPISYFRFHGRNSDAWWGNDENERYNYLYSDIELNALAIRIKSIKEQTQRVLVYFNNPPFGKAVQNARMLKKLLD